MEGKDIALGILIIGAVFLAGWVGFLYVNPVTKTKTEEDEETVYAYITTYITKEEEVIARDGIPLNWSTSEVGSLNNTFITVYNETGYANIVTFKNILQGIQLYWEQEDNPLYQRIHDYKKEYLGVHQFIDPITGILFSGVDLTDVLFFANCSYAWDISCSSQEAGTTVYWNTTTKDILAKGSKSSGYKYTMIGIAANDEFLDSFVVVQDTSYITLYNLTEIRSKSEWEVEFYVDTVLQLYKVNRTTIESAFYGSDSYSYYKEPGYTGGQYNYNRTYWGITMEDILDNIIGLSGVDYNLTKIYLADGTYSYKKGSYTYKNKLTYNNTDVRNGLDYPLKHGYVNETVAGQPWDTTELPYTTQKMVMINKEQRLYEYGITEVGGDVAITYENAWDKGYYQKYSGGPFSIVIPGNVKNNFPKWVYRIDITTF